MSFDGSKTQENLMAAFALESAFCQRLLWFAELADVDGEPELAGAFRTISEASKGRAFGLLEFLYDGGNNAAVNRAEVVGELQSTADVRYVGFATTASEEGFGDAAEWFEQMTRAHARDVSRLAAD